MRPGLLVVLWISWTLSYGQIEVSGKVVDAVTNQPIPYVSIGVTGTSFGASSNVDGEFQVFLRSPGDLKFSCIGYENLTLKSPSGVYVVKLKPSTTVLKEMVFFGESLDPREMVARAFRNVKRNFNVNTFQQTFFYRHYCKDDSVYRRIIEASVEVQKRKGYRLRRQHAGEKEEFFVPQLRRSFDKSAVSDVGHAPFSLKVILESDHAGYQARKNQGIFAILGNVNGLYYNLKRYKFSLEAVTTYDDKEVYQINYVLNDTTGISKTFNYRNSGSLFLTTDTYAIVRAENRILFFNDTLRSIVSYRQYNNKYYPYHLLREGSSNGQRSGFRHKYHIELMSTGVKDKDFIEFNGKEPSRDDLAAIAYDSTFWSTYTILSKTPLEKKIVADLGGENNLSKEFSEFQQLEKIRLSKIRGYEDDFNKLRDEVRGKRILYIDFWASWCGPCIQELEFEKRLVLKYAKDVTFVMLSIDKDEASWNRALEKYNLRIPGLAHFWIGNESDAVKFYEVNTIPRYILIDKNGNHVDLDASRPSDTSLRTQLDALLSAEK